MVRAFERGDERAEPGKGPETYAAGLRVPGGIGDHLILAAVRESDGTALVVAPMQSAASSGEVALDASYTEAHYNLGTALAERGDFENASAAFREAIRLQPDHPKAHYNLANALLAQDRWEAAALGFQEAIRIDPASAPALYNLGLLRARQGRLEEARQWLEAALAASPGFEAARAQLERVRKVLDAPGP